MQDLLVEACELLVTTYEIQLSWGIEPGVLELGMQSLSHQGSSDVCIFIRQTRGYVRLHDKRQLSLWMELRLLTSWLKIGRRSWIICRVQSNNKDILRWKKEVEEPEAEQYKKDSIWHAGFENGRGQRAMNQDMWATSGSWRKQGNRSSPRASRSSTALLAPWF